jgi:DNA-binding winged helix-turn-helix (wHTH) protein
MVGRILVLGLGADGPAVADALRAAGAPTLEGHTPDDADGVGFAAVIGRGCGPWYAALRAAARPGIRVAFADDAAAARHADLVLPRDLPPAEIAARVVARAPRRASGRWQVGARAVDLDRRTLGGEDLGPQETALLALLLAADGELVTTDRLLRDGWGTGAAETRAVDHVAHRVRRALEADPASPVHLLTVRGEGLRLVGARRVDDPPPSAAGPGLDPPAVGLDDVGLRLDAALARGGRVALVGPPGSGKSVLARAWGRERGVPVDTDDARVVTAVEAPPGAVAVPLPDRSSHLGRIARHTASALGLAPPSDDELAALRARVGPSALAVVRFVERTRWLPAAEVFSRLDAGELAVLGTPSPRDARHQSLATALAPVVDALPAGWRVALAALAADPQARVTPETAHALVAAGLVAREADGLRPWPALASWAERRTP